MQAPPSDHNTVTVPGDTVPVAIDIACPQCEYNLRGLPGPVVVCPECGLECDVPELAARRWDKPWYKAPGFNTLVWPAFCGFIWLFFVMPFTAAMVGDESAVMTVAVLGLAIWIGLMYRAYRVFDDAIAIGLAIASHLIVAGFVIGIFGLFWALLMAAFYLVNDPFELGVAVAWLFATAFLALILWASRRGERAIAGACIRHYLRRRPNN